MTSLFVKPNQHIIKNLSYGDKSITHRAIMLSLLAEGTTHIYNPCVALDTLSTLSCAAALGATVKKTDGVISVTPPKVFNDKVIFNCGNSGTTARLMAGVVAGLGVTADFFGDESLSKRPMSMLEPLKLMGAKVKKPQNSLFRISSDGLYGIDYTPPHSSAQLKSSVLLAGMGAKGVTTVNEPIVTRRHTEQMLKYMGANIELQVKKVTIKSGKLNPMSINVPNDFSLAAFLIPLGIKHGLKICNVSVAAERTGFLRVLEKSGVGYKIDVKDDLMQYGDIEIFISEIRPLNATPRDIPDMVDEVIIAAITACLAKGESVFEGLKALRTKESDRVESTCALINSIGCHAETHNDTLIVHGKGYIKGGKVATMKDHRIAMAAVIAGLLSEEGVLVDDIDIINISSSNFLNILGLNA